MGSRAGNPDPEFREIESGEGEMEGRRRKKVIRYGSSPEPKRSTPLRLPRTSRVENSVASSRPRNGKDWPEARTKSADNDSSASSDDVVHCDERERFRAGDSFDELEDDSDFEASSGKDKSKKGEKACRCSRTKCLKQYCACFRTDTRCTSDCVCVDCKNDGLHESERLLAVRHVIMNSSTAFKGTQLAPGQEVSSPGGTIKVIRGCRCKKSRCQKKYCECFGAGLSCSLSCVCVDCINGGHSNLDLTIIAAAKATVPKLQPPPPSRKRPRASDTAAAPAAPAPAAAGRFAPAPAAERSARASGKSARPAAAAAVAAAARAAAAAAESSEESSEGDESEMDEGGHDTGGESPAEAAVPSDDEEWNVPRPHAVSGSRCVQTALRRASYTARTVRRGSGSPSEDSDTPTAGESDGGDHLRDAGDGGSVSEGGMEPGSPCSRTPSTCAGYDCYEEEDAAAAAAGLLRDDGDEDGFWAASTASPCPRRGSICGGAGSAGGQCGSAGGGMRAPAQCRSGWDTDEAAPAAAAAGKAVWDSEPLTPWESASNGGVNGGGGSVHTSGGRCSGILYAGAQSPGGGLSAGGGGSIWETVGATALRACTYCPCSPMADDPLPWELGLHTANIIE